MHGECKKLSFYFKYLNWKTYFVFSKCISARKKCHRTFVQVHYDKNMHFKYLKNITYDFRLTNNYTLHWWIEIGKIIMWCGYLGGVRSYRKSVMLLLKQTKKGFLGHRLSYLHLNCYVELHYIDNALHYHQFFSLRLRRGWTWSFFVIIIIIINIIASWLRWLLISRVKIKLEKWFR